MAKLAVPLLLLLILTLAALETAALHVGMEAMPTETLTQPTFPIR